MKKIKINNKEELENFAIKFTKKLKPKDIIFLIGDLGSGKTTFVKAVGKEMGIKKIITSPTFQLIKQYEGRLCHIDAYRIFDEDIGIDSYIENNYIIFIEWPQNIVNYIKPNYTLKIKYLENGNINSRIIEIEDHERS